MKYLIISAISILGIMALSLRNTYSEPSLEKIEERPSNLEENADAEHTQFNEYWYAGLAEVSGYDLLQSRYGEIHEGKAAMIFVTEPFSKKKQVKLDNPGQAGKDNTSVLKLNSTRKFLTGIYPYSMMTSVFTGSKPATVAANAATVLTKTSRLVRMVIISTSRPSSRRDPHAP